MASGVITRVLSVRCNDVDLALCAQFLERLGTPMSTTSDIIKNVMALVASQAERTGIAPMPLQTAREYLAERYGSAGVNRNKHTYAEHAFSQNRQRFSTTPNLTHDVPKTSDGRIVSGERILEYVQWLNDNGKNKDQCSYEEWEQLLKQQEQDEQRKLVEQYKATYVPPQQQDTFDELRRKAQEQAQAQKTKTFDDEIPAGCDPSLPIAANDAPEELMARAAEREREEQEQKRLMEEFTRSMQNERGN